MSIHASGANRFGISNAIAALDNKTGETRRVLYGRARATLVDRYKTDFALAIKFIWV